jgi:octaprenyl-diphosphate synthase
MNDLKTRILAAVQVDLNAIENALVENLNPHYELVRQVAGHILFAGGKRLRPLLMILASRLCDTDRPEAVQYRCAAIFEYLHAATLLHDDVVDGGHLRRGRQVAHQVWDLPTAVLVGDFLLARSLSLAAGTRLPEVIGTIAEITEFMSQGEIQQLFRKADLNLSEADYLEVIRCKTAVLFQGSCKVGALLSKASAEGARALAAYGHHLGMAFQMADDLLDYSLDAQALGKNVGADLREGKLTLPLIYALAHANPAERSQVAALVGSQDFTIDQFGDLIRIMDKVGAIAYTRRCARAHIEKAKNALNGFAGSAARGILSDIADYALSRKA